MIINLRALNTVTVKLEPGAEEGTATITAGTLTSEVVEAAHAADAHIMTGVCNTVGVVSALIGGGLGNLVSLYGLGVDNMLSARLITASGDIVTVSEKENAELWWGLRGAGHNFGIVSELTVKAYKQVNGGMHWAGLLAFPGTPEKVEQVVEAIQGLGLGTERGKGMGATVIWGRLFPPDFKVSPAHML